LKSDEHPTGVQNLVDIFQQPMPFYARKIHQRQTRHHAIEARQFVFLQSLADFERISFKQDIVKFPGKLKVHVRLVLETQKV